MLISVFANQFSRSVIFAKVCLCVEAGNAIIFSMLLLVRLTHAMEIFMASGFKMGVCMVGVFLLPLVVLSIVIENLARVARLVKFYCDIRRERWTFFFKH